MSKKKAKPPTPPAKSAPATPPRRSKAGRPRITPPGAGPVRRLVVSDLGPYASRCLAEVKAEMAAREGAPVSDAAVVRLALAFTWMATVRDGIGAVRAGSGDVRDAEGGA